MQNYIEKLYTHEYIKNTLTSEITWIKISINNEFIENEYTYDDIIENMMANGIFWYVDAEEVPLYGGVVYKIEEFDNLFAYYNDYMIYDETERLYDKKELLFDVFYSQE